MASRSNIVRLVPNADISTVLSIPTEHLCESTADMLARSANGEPVDLLLTIGKWGDYGWFMWVPHDIDADPAIPADLYQVFAYAHKAGADYLLIDFEADMNPDLPVYPEE